MTISSECLDAAAALAGVPAGQAAAVLASHQATCPHCSAALRALRAELAEDATLAAMLATRTEQRRAEGRPLTPLRPVMRPMTASALSSRWWRLPAIPPMALAGTVAALVVFLAGAIALARLDSGGSGDFKSAAQVPGSTESTVAAGQAA